MCWPLCCASGGRSNGRVGRIVRCKGPAGLMLSLHFTMAMRSVRACLLASPGRLALLWTICNAHRPYVMWRRCITLAATASLALSVAFLLLWGRSYLCTDEITYRGPVYAFRVRSMDGWLFVIESRYLMSVDRWVFLFNARSAGGLLVDMPDVQFNVPFFSLFVWSAVLPSCRFLRPALKRRRRIRGFEVGQSAAPYQTPGHEGSHPHF